MGARRFKPGDAVWGWSVGTFQEEFYAIGDAIGLAPKGPGLDLAAIGTLPEVGATSAECLKQTGAPWDRTRNLTVMITSGSGGTGFTGVQLAKVYGAGVIATATSGAENIAFCKSLGADIVTDYKVCVTTCLYAFYEIVLLLPPSLRYVVLNIL